MLEVAMTSGPAMADRRSLSVMGYILSGVAAVVMGIGTFVVQAHLTGQFVPDDPHPVVSQSLSTSAR